MCSRADVLTPVTQTTPVSSQTPKSSSNNDSSNNNNEVKNIHHEAAQVAHNEASKSGTGFITTISSILVIVFLLVCWVFYAYTHPHTSSGQFLIQYRPNAWRFRRGEARYTAATIHM
jgi:predicted PurR-regulated permease PerM